VVEVDPNTLVADVAPKTVPMFIIFFRSPLQKYELSADFAISLIPIAKRGATIPIAPGFD
jgi:hypothetical protein